MNIIKIKQPKYSTQQVLIACKRVKRGENLVVFTEDTSRSGIVYGIDSSEIKRCEITSNGGINCYAVPLCKLTPKNLVRLNI